MNRTGRKITMLIFAIPFIIGWLIIGFANTLTLVYLGRFITGLCGSAFTTIVPVYVGEIAEKTIRGALSTMMILMLVTGVLFSSILGAITTWQILSFILISIPTLLLILAIPFLPETPRFYITKGKKDKAAESLKYLRKTGKTGKNNNVREIQRELQLIQENFRQDEEDSTNSFKDLFIMSSLKPIIISIALIAFQQLSGANAVSFRQVEVIQSAGTNWDPNLISSLIAGSQVLLVLVPTFTVDRIGRKILMIISEIIMILGLIGLAVYFYLKDHVLGEEGSLDFGWLPLTSLLIFTVGYNVGMGPIPFVVSAELLPSQSRGLATAIVIEFYYILSISTTILFGYITESLGWTSSYSLFAVICLIGLLFISIIVPETKGKSNEQIELLFKRKSTVRKVSIRSSIKSQSYNNGNGPPTRNSSSVAIIDMNEPEKKVKKNSVVTIGVDNPAFDG